MIYNRYLFTSPSILTRRAELLKDLKENVFTTSVYLIALSENGIDLLDIYRSELLIQKHFQESSQLVIGLASDKEEAQELACEIVNIVHEKTGGFDIASYVSKPFEEDDSYDYFNIS